VKKIVFSIFNDNVDQNHKSTNDFKLSQFKKWAPQLEFLQREYANRVGADYVLHRTNTTDYNSIQFERSFSSNNTQKNMMLYISRL